MIRHQADYSHQSEDALASRTSLEAATEAAQRVNALLIAKGILKPSQVSAVPHKTKQQVFHLTLGSYVMYVYELQ